MSKYIKESINVKQSFLEKNNLSEVIDLIIETITNKNKLLICGNGGSATNAQHFSAELVGRYKLDRKSLPAIALTTDSSIITAIGNDYGYSEVFSRQIEGLGNINDVLFAISTSGNSPNLLRAIEEAKNNNINVIGLLGKDGGKMKEICDLSIIIPSDNTPRIQELHIMVIHIICEILEDILFKNE
ncbi:MAG: D-sedoheptulose 7-phosphate isomerase [Gammaproteobacteria bacterium]|nr:D-sedoheptulose 7-phosphate isomerase [Gammaproteobacteria bacterium]